MTSTSYTKLLCRNGTERCFFSLTVYSCAPTSFQLPSWDRGVVAVLVVVVAVAVLGAVVIGSTVGTRQGSF